MTELTIQQSFYIIEALASVAILAVLFILLIGKVDFKKLSNKIALGIAIICATCAIAGAVWELPLIQQAKEHGLYSYDVPLMKLPENIANSPVDQSAEIDPADIKPGTFIVMYRLTCPDCEAIYSELDARLKSTQYPTYYVSSRSENGIILRDKFNIEEVPALIAIDDNGRTYVSVAYTHDSAGNTILNDTAIEKDIRNMNTARNTKNATDEAASIISDIANTVQDKIDELTQETESDNTPKQTEPTDITAPDMTEPVDTNNTTTTTQPSE